MQLHFECQCLLVINIAFLRFLQFFPLQLTFCIDCSFFTILFAEQCHKEVQASDLSWDWLLSSLTLRGCGDARFTMDSHSLRHSDSDNSRPIYTQHGQIKTKLGLMLQPRRRADYAEGRARLCWPSPLHFPSCYPFLSPLPFPLGHFLPLTPPSLPLRSRPRYILLGSLRKRCKLPRWGLGQSPSWNRISCILASKYEIWWQQF